MERTPHDNDTSYINKGTVKRIYGLSDRWIAQLEPPDRIGRHPLNRSKKIALYLRARVDLFITAHQADYDALIHRRTLRYKYETTGAFARRRQLRAWAACVEIEIAPLPQSKRQLEEATVEQQHRFHLVERADVAPPCTPSHTALIAYIRHSFTNYADLIRQVEREDSFTDAYAIIKQRVNTCIEARLAERFGTSA